MRYSTTTLLALSLTAASSSAQPESAPIAAAEFDADASANAVFADLDGIHSPGCAAGVYRRGAIELLRGWGMASIEHAMPVDGDTVFYAGSVSKQFTAAAVLLAARADALSLDDPIRRWFPELGAWAEPIRVHHLLHHTSGLRDYLTLMALAGVPFETPVEAEWIEALVFRQQAGNFAPGTEYLYSNTGYFLLGRLVERAAGETLADFARRRIFEPLGMRATRFHDDRDRIVARRALAYGRVTDGTVRVNWSPAFDHVGGGGLLTTTRDLAAWDASFYDGRLGDGFWDEMTATTTLADGTPLDYARGLRIDEVGGHRRIQHGGAMFGYRAQFSRFPDAGLTVAVLCNVADADPQARASALAALWLPGADAQEQESAPDPADGAETSALPPDPEAWIGRYASAELGAVATVTRGDGTLLWQAGLAPAAAIAFHADGSAELPRGRATADTAAGGRVRTLTVDAGRVRDIEFRRTP